MKNLPVAIFLPSLLGGGAERMMVNLANGFAARGLAVDLVLAKAEGPYMSEVDPATRVVDLRAGRVLTSLPGLIRYLRRERPRALLSALNHANVVAVVAHRFARVPTRLVISERNVVRVCSDSLTGHWLQLLMRWTYPKADAVVAVSRGVGESLVQKIGFSRDKLEIIYNPVVAPELFARAQEPLEHPWFQPGAPPVILGVGRLNRQKDFPALLRAFARLRSVREVRLVILGDGELRQELVSLAEDLGIADEVALPGFVSNPFPWMKRAAVFVLSSAWEGLPGVLIQAMACGAPVVSTDCPSGPAEILEDGRWGRLVPVGNETALADAIASTMDDKNHPDVVKRALDFRVESAVDRYLSVLGVKP